MKLTEGVMVVDGLKRAANKLIAGWRYFVGEEITVSTSSCIVAS